MKRQFLTKTFALTCLFSLLTEVVYPSVVSIGFNKIARFSSSSSGSAPVADAANDMVDLYTGDFRYGVPLMSVPGPNGENVDITLGYHGGGIRADEKASWVGLGWDYNPGEISRQVVGVADDYCGQTVFRGINSSNYYYPSWMYGPFYYNQISTASTFPSLIPNGVSYSGATRTSDQVAIENPIESTLYNWAVAYIHPPTSLPAYGVPPRFFSKVSAPYVQPAYDKYFISGPGISGKLKPYILDPNTTLYFQKYGYPSNPTIAKTQFYFEGSTNKTIISADGADNRIKSGYFVKYYTNNDINNSSKLFNNSTQIGFLDYRIISGTRRPTTDFDANGIGGIEVTDPTGITYHYSLPVYSKEELGKTMSYYPSNPNDITLTATNIGSHEVDYKPHPCATSWKLTSITGPDYQDVNGDKVVDEGDTGYWIAYNYSLWNNEHLWTSHVFNAGETMLRQNSSLTRLTGYGGYIGPTFKKAYYSAQGKAQVYYLNYIRTSTHTAYFIKDVRLDEHSYDNIMYTSTKPNALLKLNRIVLLTTVIHSYSIVCSPIQIWSWIDH